MIRTVELLSNGGADFDAASLEAYKELSGKYKTCIHRLLVKIPNGGMVPPYLTVTFMDRNGFKVNTLVLNGRQFKEAGIPDHWEVNESQSYSEKYYKQAKRYSVSTQ